MAAGNKAPSSISEAYAGVLQALAAAMTAPDAGPAIPFLIEMQKAVAGQMQKGNAPQGGQKPPGPAGPPGQGGPPGGGGMSLGALQGQPQQPPGPGGGGGPSASGISQDDLRRMVGAQAGTPG